MLGAVHGTLARTERQTFGDRSTPLGAAVGVVTALAYLPGIDRSLTYDGAESVGFFVLADSPVDALKGQRAFNNHPLFSFVENLIVHVAGHSDEWLLRLFPITCAATAVGVLVWAVSRTAGSVAGLTAGVVVATNPMYVEQGRDVRGYSLMVLCAIVATVLHLRLVEQESARRRLAYVIVAVAGLMTHFAIAPVFLGHAIDVARRRTLDRRWLGTWAAIAAMALGFYAHMLGELLETGESRGRIFRPWFLPDLLRELLGRSWPSVVTLGVLTATGLYATRRHRTTTSLTAVALAVAAALWLAAPENLAPRFFIWLVPAVGLLSAHATAIRPRIVFGAAAVAAVFSAAAVLPDYLETGNRYPEVAAIIEREAATGRRVCVTNLSVAPMLAYTPSFQPLVELDDARRCDVVAVAEPSLDGRYLDALAEDLPHRTDLDAPVPAVILSRSPLGDA